MAYVRERGNQLAIVQGERDPATGKVEQRVLFSVCSKPEALAVLGQSDARRAASFERLLEKQYPDIDFSWESIRQAIQEKMDMLPDTYEYQQEKLLGSFHSDLCRFARQLLLADPQDLMSAAQLIQSHRHELEYMAALIQWRLRLRDQREDEWNRDNHFFWRLRTLGGDAPQEAEEMGVKYFNQGDFGRARSVFSLLIDCFDNYADGHNSLGIIALEESKLDEAIACFEKAIEVGRKRFPKRISKKQYGSDLKTRPYLRGLHNLALALNLAGRYEEALACCDRLERECGDEGTASWYRAGIALNASMWQQAVELAARASAPYSRAADLIVAFGLAELGRFEDAMAPFLHAALNHPRAARLVLGERTRRPTSHDEVEEHHFGVSLARNIHGFLANGKVVSKGFFRKVVRDPRVTQLLDEVIALTRREKEQHAGSERTEAFDRIMLMKSIEFARVEARKMRDLPGVRVR